MQKVSDFKCLSESMPSWGSAHKTRPSPCAVSPANTQPVWPLPGSWSPGATTTFCGDSRIGSFGEEEYYARAIALRGMISDGKNTYVPIGLTRLDSVIVKWDRPFKNGDTVAIAMN